MNAPACVSPVAHRGRTTSSPTLEEWQTPVPSPNSAEGAGCEQDPPSGQ